MNQEKHYEVLLQRAAGMRANMTKAESKLWGFLRNPFYKAPTFHAQHVVYPYIVDFVCLENLLVIEVDGGSHDSVGDSDGIRDAELSNAGFKVIRFSNGEVLLDIDNVIKAIQFECKFREKANQNVPKPITKRSTNRMMIVPLPRLVYEVPAVSNSRTRASKVRVRKVANSKNGNTKTVPCAICKQAIADNDLRARHRIPNNDDVLWAHKSCK
jgi:very-short-patch-repair endonuclease